MRTLLLAVMIVPLFAQEPPPPGDRPRRPVPEPKNLKVLKVPASELIPLMRNYSVSLGVRCDHCHVQGNFASDEKPQKETARKMIQMAENLNTTLGDGKVTCYTCHRGEVEPKTIAPTPPPGQQGPPPAQRPPQ